MHVLPSQLKQKVAMKLVVFKLQVLKKRKKKTIARNLEINIPEVCVKFRDKSDEAIFIKIKF